MLGYVQIDKAVRTAKFMLLKYSDVEAYYIVEYDGLYFIKDDIGLRTFTGNIKVKVTRDGVTEVAY